MRKGIVSGVAMAAILMVGSFLVTKPTHAASAGDVLISEFVSAPTSGQEWYELQNTTTTAIDLSGWIISRTLTADTLTLSGTLPAYGILVFSATASATNDAGDAVTLLSGTTTISAVTYGVVASPSPLVPHASAPGTDQSAAAAISTATTPPTITYTVGTPTKGWFNDAVAISCAQMGAIGTTTAPTLGSIATCLSSESQVTTNLGSLADPSAATDLYFEKSVSGSPMGRITFAGPLNLTDLTTVSYLQAIGEKMQAALVNGVDVKVGLDTSITSLFSTIPATITMYSVPGTTTPDLLVTNNAGDIVAPGTTGYPTISGATFDATAHTYTFSTNHFTTFQTNTAHPTVKNLGVSNGSYVLTNGSKKVTLTPFGKNYKGTFWGKKVTFTGTSNVVYLFANQSATAKGAIMAYDKAGKLLGTYKPFTSYATKGLVLDIAVQSNNTVFVAAGASNSLTVMTYKVTAKGLTAVNSVKALKTAGKIVVKFSKIYSKDYGLLTYLQGKKTTLKVWKFNATTKKFVEDTAYSKSKVKI